MPAFLSGDILAAVVKRLARSASKRTVTDYLVFKRALVLTNAGKKGTSVVNAVVTGTTSEPFRRAIDEMAACATSKAEWDGSPFFSPFGADHEKGAGFKGPSYPSNGPSDTVGGWQTRGATPLQVVPKTTPRQFSVAARTTDELARFFLRSEGIKETEKRPTLADAAAWWFRFDDLEKRFGKKPNAEELVEAFAIDLGLTAEERAGIFWPQPVPNDFPGLTFSDSIAPPGAYLPAVPAAQKAAHPAEPQKINAAKATAVAPSDFEGRVAKVVEFVESRGFYFEPWQVAAFITAVRTKPFIILAGISGTGKTKLPRLVAEATAAKIEVIAVRPDWTDSSELLGYERIDGKFVPGHLLRIAKDACDHPEQQYFVLLDEMNIARVEYYLAEVLSHVEEKSREGDTIRSQPILWGCADPAWADVRLPSNLCIVGSVNMDESTQQFSKKVLDRSFVIEFSDVDLSIVHSVLPPKVPQSWTASDWQQRYLSLGEYPDLEAQAVVEAIGALTLVNEALEPVQLHVGYRVRDEIVLFCLNARDCIGSFTTSAQETIDPLDLALSMKILPRVQGSGALIDNALKALRDWAAPSAATPDQRSFPYSGERIGRMQQRLESGFTSYWL